MKDMIPDLIAMLIVAAYVFAICYVVVMTFKCHVP